MRNKYICVALGCMVAFCGGATLSSAAQIRDGACVGAISPAIESMVAEADGNLEQLRQSVRSAVVTDFRRAQDVICLARGTSPEVKAAIAVGVLEAHNTIGFSDPEAADEIVTWVGSADEAFQAAYFGAQARISAQINDILIPRSMGGGFSGGVVSPSKP
jgi:hypothetical protein